MDEQLLRAAVKKIGDEFTKFRNSPYADDLKQIVAVKMSTEEWREILMALWEFDDYPIVPRL